MKTYALPIRVDGLIFDIDSTLYRNKEYTVHQEAVLLQRLSDYSGDSLERTVDKVNQYRSRFAAAHNGRKPSLGNTFLHFGIPIPKSVEWREELIQPEQYLSHDPVLTDLFESIKRRYKMICVTNNPGKIGRRTLEALGIQNPDLDIIGLDTTLVSKPHKKPFLEASNRLGINVTRLISIGDRYEVDLEVPIELGMGGILVESMDDLYRIEQFLPQKSE